MRSLKGDMGEFTKLFAENVAAEDLPGAGGRRRLSTAPSFVLVVVNRRASA